ADEPVYLVEHLLRPLDGERGDEDVTAGLQRPTDHLRELRAGLLQRAVAAVGVRGLDDDRVCVHRWDSRQVKRALPVAQVAREDDALALGLHDDVGAAEYVAGRL